MARGMHKGSLPEKEGRTQKRSNLEIRQAVFDNAKITSEAFKRPGSQKK